MVRVVFIVGALVIFGPKVLHGATAASDAFDPGVNEPVANAVLVDTNFLPPLGSSFTTLVAQPDGRILVSGYFTNTDGVSRRDLLRLQANGSFDNSLRLEASASIRTLSLQPDGSMFIGGSFTTLGGVSRPRLAQVDARGNVTGYREPLKTVVLKSNSLASERYGRQL